MAKKSRKLKAITLIALIAFTGSLFLLFPSGDITKSRDGNIVLAAPPSQIVNSFLDAPAINTTTTALFGWDDLDDYGTIAGFVLFDSVAVMLNYTDHGDAIDGWVRVWDMGSQYTCTDDDPDDDNCFVDVWVRVRSDKTLIGQVFQSQTDSGLERGVAYVWWNHSVEAVGSLPSYSTSVGRALAIVSEDGLNITDDGGAFVFDYSEMNYYDYEFPVATRLFVFGYTNLVSTATIVNYFFYYTPEATSTIENAVLVHGARRPTSAGNPTNATVAIDGGAGFVQLASKSGTSWSIGWFGHDVIAQTAPATQTTVNVYQLGANSASVYSNVAVLVWTS